MTDVRSDPVRAFYERHPYPPPVGDLEALAARPGRPGERRAAHHLVWPRLPSAGGEQVLVAGCGTSQAVRHALRRPDAEVVAIDVSATAVDHTVALAERHHVRNLTVHRLAIEDAGELGTSFDHVVCTGVLHHLADPLVGLRTLRSVLAPGGAVSLMVYARYGRTGVAMLQEYCRRLGVEPSEVDLADLTASLREVPLAHPISHLLREAPDFGDDGALADALLNPRERTYSVPEVLDLVAGAGLVFGRWNRQAPYLPDCGAIATTPHAARIAALPEAEQHAALELFRGTMTRHSLIAHAATDGDPASRLDFDDPEARRWVPIPVPTAVAITERLPPGGAAALLNRAHTSTDLVMFVDADQLAIYRAIDGERTVAELGGDVGFIERLWRHDLVVVDASRSRGGG